jgi:C3HC zinc finger-like
MALSPEADAQRALSRLLRSVRQSSSSLSASSSNNDSSSGKLATRSETMGQTTSEASQPHAQPQSDRAAFRSRLATFTLAWWPSDASNVANIANSQGESGGAVFSPADAAARGFECCGGSLARCEMTCSHGCGAVVVLGRTAAEIVEEIERVEASAADATPPHYVALLRTALSRKAPISSSSPSKGSLLEAVPLRELRETLSRSHGIGCVWRSTTCPTSFWSAIPPTIVAFREQVRSNRLSLSQAPALLPVKAWKVVADSGKALKWYRSAIDSTGSDDESGEIETLALFGWSRSETDAAGSVVTCAACGCEADLSAASRSADFDAAAEHRWFCEYAILSADSLQRHFHGGKRAAEEELGTAADADADAWRPNKRIRELLSG